MLWPTFDRHGIAVTIRTRHGDITTGKQAKHGFADIKTLHALIREPRPTLVSLGLSSSAATRLARTAVEEAKALFLRYAGDEELGVTADRDCASAHGCDRASHESTSMGCGSLRKITSCFLTTSPRPLRHFVVPSTASAATSAAGAYTDRVKTILLACDEDEVIDALVIDLQNYERGTQHDETQWLDVGLHACKQLNARRKVIFLTAFELAYAPDFVQRARDDGYEIMVVPETNPREAAQPARRRSAIPIRDLDRYRDEWQDSFRFTFHRPGRLHRRRARGLGRRCRGSSRRRGGRPRHHQQTCASPRPCDSWKAVIRKPSESGTGPRPDHRQANPAPVPGRSSPEPSCTSCRTPSAARPT